MTNHPRGWQTGAAQARPTGFIDEGLRQHMLRVYNYMTMGLAITGLVAVLTANSPALLNLIFGTGLRWVVIFAPLGFVLALSFGIARLSVGTVQALFWAYSAVMGLSLASLFLLYTGESIARVFFISAATFGATSLYGYSTRRDLSAFGSFMVMGLFGLIIAMVVNLFLQSDQLAFLVSAVGVLVFTGLTAWDTQRIKEMYVENQGWEAGQKLAVMGALTLYLDFINLFLMMLRLTGSQRQ